MAASSQSSFKPTCAACGVTMTVANRCSRCLQVCYCSKKCQRADWITHQTQCVAKVSNPKATVTACPSTATAEQKQAFAKQLLSNNDTTAAAQLAPHMLDHAVQMMRDVQQMAFANPTNSANKIILNDKYTTGLAKENQPDQWAAVSAETVAANGKSTFAQWCSNVAPNVPVVRSNRLLKELLPEINGDGTWPSTATTFKQIHNYMLSLDADDEALLGLAQLWYLYSGVKPAI